MGDYPWGEKSRAPGSQLKSAQHVSTLLSASLNKHFSSKASLGVSYKSMIVYKENYLSLLDPQFFLYVQSMSIQTDKV